MANTFFGFQIANRHDPLANVKSLRIWSAQLPANDPVGAVEAIIRLLETAGATQPVVTVHRLRAVVELDRMAVPLQAQLRTQYRMSAMSDEVRERLWRACDELAHWFAHVYEQIYEGIRAPGDNKKARAELHGIFARMFHYVGVQARQGLFRYERWIPGKWKQLHTVYQEACEQGAVAEPYTLDPFAQPGERLSPEQEYLQILLLQRLNTGNLTPQQIDWAAEWLRAWAPSLRLAMTQPDGDGYWLDLGQGEGLTAKRPQQPVGELLYLDIEPLQGQLSVLLTRLAEQVAASPGQAELAEQLALARRMEQLWLPRAPQQARRGERRPEKYSVNVAAGWAEIALALAVKFVRKTGTPPGYHYDDYGRLRADKDRMPGSVDPRKSDPYAWQIHDTSDSGFGIRSASPQAARQRPGALLAMQLEDDPHWQIGIVRRLKKLNAFQIELGVEIISRNGELIMPKQLEARDTGYSVNGIDIGMKGKGFNALYLPPQFPARSAASPSLVVPSAEFTIGRMLSLLVDGHHHDICLTTSLERTKDWVWTPLEVVG